MQTRLIKAACLFLVSTSLHIPWAGAATLVYVYGTVIQPPNLNVNDQVQPGTVVRAGKDAIVAIEETWESSSGPCTKVTVFGYGQSYTVTQRASGGSCLRQAPNLSSAQTGTLTEGERLASSKGDQPSDNTESQARWRNFDNWIQGARRSFTGVLTAEDASTVRLRSKSGTEMVFTLSATTLDTPAGLNQMLNQTLRVDYRAGFTPRAERITLPETP